MAQYEIVFNRGKDQLHKLETCSNKMRLQMLKENKQLDMKFLVHTNHFLVDNMSPDSGPTKISIHVDGSCKSFFSIYVTHSGPMKIGMTYTVHANDFLVECRR